MTNFMPQMLMFELNVYVTHNISVIVSCITLLLYATLIFIYTYIITSAFN